MGSDKMGIVQYQTNIHPMERMHNVQIWSVYVQFAGGSLEACGLKQRRLKGRREGSWV